MSRKATDLPLALGRRSADCDAHRRGRGGVEPPRVVIARLPNAVTLNPTVSLYAQDVFLRPCHDPRVFPHGGRTTTDRNFQERDSCGIRGPGEIAGRTRPS